jgi:hypothetical protein
MNNFYFGHKLNLVSIYYQLKPLKDGAPGAIRTRDPRLRRPPRRKGVNRCTPAKNVKLTYLKAFNETR